MPVRGTQSFVAVMVEVWKRPSLTALEVLWRWAAWIPLLWLGWHAVSPALLRAPFDKAALQAMTFFQPVQAVEILRRQLGLIAPAWMQVGRWWLPLALAVWAVAAAIGRTAIFRRLDPTLVSRPAVIGLFALLRSSGFLLVLLVWMEGVIAAARYAVTLPAQRGAEPNIILLTALVVGLTLLLFMLWSLLVWIFDLVPVVAVTGTAGFPDTLRLVLRNRTLRSKLIELNFVMGVVKVCLLVLAMVFSASPLPFQSQETQSFITVWWIGVGVLYVLFSDLFHVVRRVTCFRLLESLSPETAAEPSPAS